MEIVPPNLRRFSVADYCRLHEMGMLGEHDNLELLDGVIFKQLKRGPLHDSVMTQAAVVLRGAISEGWHARTRASVITKDSVPEPDLTVVRGSLLDYRDRYPEYTDTTLIAEV